MDVGDRDLIYKRNARKYAKKIESNQNNQLNLINNLKQTNKSLEEYRISTSPFKPKVSFQDILHKRNSSLPENSSTSFNTITNAGTKIDINHIDHQIRNTQLDYYKFCKERDQSKIKSNACGSYIYKKKYDKPEIALKNYKPFCDFPIKNHILTTNSMNASIERTSNLQVNSPSSSINSNIDNSILVKDHHQHRHQFNDKSSHQKHKIHNFHSRY